MAGAPRKSLKKGVTRSTENESPAGTKLRAKKKLPTREKDTITANDEAPQAEATNSAAMSPVDRIYKTVTLENDIMEDGLWIMRRLGNGKYEAVNLNAVTNEDISSEENEATMVSAPERVKLFRATQESLKELTVKLDRAVFTGGGKVFRFNKLPIELRYKIYDFALISTRGLRPLPSGGLSEARLGLGLLATCHSINEECRRFVWKNFFNLSTPSMKILKQVKQRLVQNVQHVRYDWGGNQGKDFFILAMLATCTKLESLEIVVDVRCVNRPTQGWNSHKPQRLHQDDSRIQKFSRTNGFDKLISLGELKKVIVTKNWTIDHAIKHGQVTEAEFKAFGDFVKEKLTRRVKPILAMPPVVLAEQTSTPTRKSSRIQTLQHVKPVKYVSDPVSDDEEYFLDEEDDAFE